MKIIILAAGYAVRLQPLTTNMPKSLLKVGGVTIMDRIMNKLKAVKGWDRAYVVTNDKFYGKFNEWAGQSSCKDRLLVLNDGTTSNENRLGAIKDMRFVIEEQAIDDDLLIVAGDNLFEFDIIKFMEFAHSKDGVSLALYDIGSFDRAKSFGVLKIDALGRVVEFEEKPQNPKSTLVSTGVYYFPKNKIPFIEKYVTMQAQLDAPGYYISWLSKQDNVYGFKFTEDWFDIGSIESYKAADQKYKEKEM